MHHLLSDPDGREDLALAVAIWVLAGTVYWSASQLPPPIFDPVGSAAIPKLVSITLAIIAAVILLQRIAIGRRNQEATAVSSSIARDMPLGTAAPLRGGIALACILIMLGYTAIMTYGLLGFRDSTIPFIILLGGTLSRFRRSTMLILVPSAFMIGFGFDWLFSEILYIDLPVTRWLAWSNG
jgi:putative tricarboxylic transport membrane protein